MRHKRISPRLMLAAERRFHDRFSLPLAPVISIT